MIDLETYIIEIVKKTGLSKTEIQEMVHKKQSKSNKAISEKSALILVTRELCVELSLKDSIIIEKSDSIIDRAIEDLAVRLRDNLLAVYGIGSYFEDSLPSSFIKNDIDLIAIVRTTENLRTFRRLTIGKSEVFVGYNTIESYGIKKVFGEDSGANYEWSLICIKHPENSKLLHGTDIRDQVPETTNIQFDYDNILIRGYYHLEKSLENKKKDIAKAKREYSKAMFKFGYYFCVLHDTSFRYVSLIEIRKKLGQLYKPDTNERQTFLYFEEAFEYRLKGDFDSDFYKLQFKTRYYFISLLRNGKTHRPMDYGEIKAFFSSYFGGLPILKVFVRNLDIKKHLEKK